MTEAMADDRLAEIEADQDAMDLTEVAGLCSYGHCDQAPTHIGAGRRCCEPHAQYLADINGDGSIAEIGGAGT